MGNYAGTGASNVSCGMKGLIFLWRADGGGRRAQWVKIVMARIFFFFSCFKSELFADLK